MASTSLLTLIQTCPVALGWYAQDAPSAAATSTTSWQMNATDAGWDDATPGTEYKYVWAKVEADSAGTPLNVGEVRRVTSFTPSNATFSLSSGRGWSNALTTTQTVGLYHTVPPTTMGMIKGWSQYISDVLRQGIYGEPPRYRRYGLLTLVTDGDMEASATSDWTALNSATLSKVTTAANVTWGGRALRVQGNGATASPGARSALIAVTPGDVGILRCDLMVATGTGVVAAYDQTNSTTIESESTTSTDQRYLDFTFTVPSTCTSISIRLSGTGVSDDVYFDNCSLRLRNQHRFALPSWVDKEMAFEWLTYYAGLSNQSDAYLVSGQLMQELPHCRVLSDFSGSTQYYVEYNVAPPDRALLFVRGLSAFDALSADSSTTTCDRDLLVAGARAAALKDQGHPRAKEFLQEYNARRLRLPRWSAPISGGWR